MASVTLTNHLTFHSTEKCWWTCCSHYCPCAADEAMHTGRAQVKLHPFLSLALGASMWSVSGPSHSMSLQPLAPSQQEAQWAPELVWTFWRTEKWLALAGNQILDFLACSVVIIWRQVSQLTSCYTRLALHMQDVSPCWFLCIIHSTQLSVWSVFFSPETISMAQFLVLLQSD
jgi:hypothetical protein